MAIQKAEGIVLRNHKIRETSQITTLYTREFGKLDCLVKGLRSDKSRYGSRLEILSYNRIVFYEKPKTGLHLISQCDLLDSFDSIQSNLKSLAYASYFLELLNEFAKPHDKDEELFFLLHNSLKFLDSIAEPKTSSLIESYILKLSFVFEVKLLQTAGLMPKLEHCVACHSQSEDAVSFSHLLGGVLCRRCRLKDRQARPILKGVTSTLIHLEKEEFQRLVSGRFRILAGIAKQLKIILKAFIRFHLEKDLKTRRFLDRMDY